MKNILFILFITFTSVITVYGQGGKIVGVVKDGVSGERLIGTYVIVEETSFAAVTNIDGEYILPSIPEGDYILKVSYIGYEDIFEELTVDAGGTHKVNFKLQFSGVALGAATITAQAKGQISAINDQLNSSSIVNVVSSERIQELPDANAAETLGRIPGVSVSRVGGEGNKVVIRGLSPKYNKIMFEGASMAGGESDRSTDISMISPYALGGIEVIKSATAEHDADFIGGAVNFKLRSAEVGWHYDIVAQSAHNALKKTTDDYMLVGSVSNRFLNNKLGVYLQGNIERRNRSANGLSAAYDVKTSAMVGITNPVFIDFLKLTDVIRQRERKGATVVFDYKIKDGSIHFKNIYNSGLTSVNRFHQTFDIKSRKLRYEARDEQKNLHTISNFIDFEKRIGVWKVDAKIAHSFASNTEPSTLSFIFEQNGALASAVKDNSIAPTEVVNFTTIDHTKTFFDNYDESVLETEERQMSASLNLQYDFSISKQVSGFIKTGAKYRYKKRFHDRELYGGDLSIGSGQSANDAILEAFPWMQETVSIGNVLPYTLFIDEDFKNQADFLSGDYELGAVADLVLMKEALEVLKNTEGLPLDGFFNKERSSNTFDYNGNEEFAAGYLMAEINIGKKIKFIPGVRYESNKTTYTAVQGVTNIAFAERSYIKEDTTAHRSNAFLLPMIHLKLSPLKWLNVRLAYTQTLSRPSYNQFTPRRDRWDKNISYNNYGLLPERSENIDLYLSFHGNKLGLFTIGGFSKKIKDMIFNLNKQAIIDPAEFNLAEEHRFRFIYTPANNKKPAFVRGMEVDWQINFWFLPGGLKGLVLNVNYTRVFSEAQYPRTLLENLAENPWDPPIFINKNDYVTGQLLSQPDNIFNLQVGYDYKGFSTRVSMLYESTKLTRPNTTFPELALSTDKYLRWDISIKQKLPWYNMQVFCNINNVSGEQERTYVQNAQWDANLNHYGATIDFGLRMTL